MELGLIGRSLSHSFSLRYFASKFQQEGLTNYRYRNFELENISTFPQLLKDYPELRGLNVTVPYKSDIIPYLDEIDLIAREIGAVNTLLIKDGRIMGFNTDYLGFSRSLIPLLSPQKHRALLLGTGGAAQAIGYALDFMDICHKSVSRKPSAGELSYQEAHENLSNFNLVVNCTPMGTFPNIEEMPPLKLDNVSENHLFYDLVYNPEKSRLLMEAEKRGARVKNGYEMLVLQAEEAWKIWHKV